MDPSPPTDGELVARILEGEADCMEPLVARYGGALGAVLRRALGPGAEWEDAAQEAWMRVIRYASSYDPTYAFSTWLFKLAWNVALDRRRRLRHEVQETGLSEPADEGAHPEALLLRKEREQAVRSGIAGLPDHLAEAVLLRHFETLTEREMAHCLGIPPGTVKSRLHHAHRRLALLLRGLS